MKGFIAFLNHWILPGNWVDMLRNIYYLVFEPLQVLLNQIFQFKLTIRTFLFL